MLTRLNPRSLAPVSRGITIGEYHNAWSFSPDHSRLALAISAPAKRGRIGILIVDTGTLRIARKVETGIAAEAMEWFGPQLLAAVLQRGGAILVDGATGRIIRRWRDLVYANTALQTRFGLLALTREPRTERIQLTIIDPRGDLHSISLSHIHLPAAQATPYADTAGLVVDPDHPRAFVFAPDGTVAIVSLLHRRVAYVRLDNIGVGRQQAKALARLRDAAWLGDHQVVIYGRDIVGTSTGAVARSAGATLVATTSWRACVLDQNAGAVATGTGVLLTYGGGGLDVYASNGVKLFHLFGKDDVASVHVLGRWAYVQLDRQIRVVDIRTGSVIDQAGSDSVLVDILLAPNG